jgi:hypothetical protein
MKNWTVETLGKIVDDELAEDACGSIANSVESS